MHGIQTKSLEPAVKNATYLTGVKTWGDGNLMEISWSTHHSWKYSSFFSRSNLLSNPRLLLSLCDFLCLYLTTWFLTFFRPFAPQGGSICIYVHACILCICAWVTLRFFLFCVCRLWENQTWRDIWHPFRHCLTFLSRTIMLIYTHPRGASGVKCLNLKFGTNIIRCFIYTWNEMKIKSAVC